eukprot:1149345-Rhodomonas_salina.2
MLVPPGGIDGMLLLSKRSGYPIVLCSRYGVRYYLHRQCSYPVLRSCDASVRCGHSVCGTHYCAGVVLSWRRRLPEPSYAAAMRCAVLKARMLLPLTQYRATRVLRDVRY